MFMLYEVYIKLSCIISAMYCITLFQQREVTNKNQNDFITKGDNYGKSIISLYEQITHTFECLHWENSSLNLSELQYSSNIYANHNNFTNWINKEIEQQREPCVKQTTQ